MLLRQLNGLRRRDDAMRMRDGIAHCGEVGLEWSWTTANRVLRPNRLAGRRERLLAPHLHWGAYGLRFRDRGNRVRVGLLWLRLRLSCKGYRLLLALDLLLLL